MTELFARPSYLLSAWMYFLINPKILGHIKDDKSSIFRIFQIKDIVVMTIKLKSTC